MASKAVLITGCSTGIGRKTAEHLAANGWTVYATVRRLESIAELEQKGCKTLALDVTDEESMKAAVAAVERAEGAVGVLINNAGYSQSGAVEEVPMDQVRRQFETNVFGLLRMSQLVLPGMRRQGFGKIVNISSMGGRVVFPGGDRLDERPGQLVRAAPRTRRAIPQANLAFRAPARKPAIGGPVADAGGLGRRRHRPTPLDPLDK